MMRSRLVPLAGVLLVVLGVALGFQVRDAVSADDDYEQFRKIQEAYAYITRNYVERVDSAQLSESAIEGMLNGLDPHSIYITAEEMQAVRENFDASFEGIGIYYEFVEGVQDNDTLVVLMPIAGGPSEEAGLQPGDRITRIDDTTAIGFTQELVQKYLKGPKGSEVTLQVRRPGYRDLLTFDITRDEIPIETVTAAYMEDETTGYIKLQRFARTSHEEVTSAIQMLKEQGMARLILDLRDNAGGLLDQAYEISDEFLTGDQMIVYTDSRHPGNRRQYYANDGGVFEEGPLMVLINENSASASEIVAGAVQDHDRALVVGRRSFGKGLVQQQFPLSDGSVLQMTVSRYYTPAGRLIQTPFELGETEEDYFAAKRDLRDHLEYELDPDGGFVDPSIFEEEVPDSLVFTTDGGRTVYGGGGILPDYIVPVDTLAPALRTVIGRNLDSEFARATLESAEGRALRNRWQDRRAEFMQDYTVSEDLFNNFLAFAEAQGVPVVADRDSAEAENVLVRSEAIAVRTDIEARIKAFFARRFYGVDAFYPIVAPIDPVMVQAMGLWDDAVSLAVQSR